MALAAKRVDTGASLGTTVMAAQWADGVWPLFVLLGLEHAEIRPGITAVTPLDFVSYPFSHSLVADLGWAALFALAYGTLRKDWRAALWLGALVMSHWMLDVVAHRPDMPTWPGGPKLGAGLWNSAAGDAGRGIRRCSAPASGSTAARRRRATAWADVLPWTFVGNARDHLPRGGLRSAASRASAYWRFPASLGWLFVAWGYWIDRHRAPIVAERVGCSLRAAADGFTTMHYDLAMPVTDDTVRPLRINDTVTLQQRAVRHPRRDADRTCSTAAARRASTCAATR